jgi:hypothetical protein
MVGGRRTGMVVVGWLNGKKSKGMMIIPLDPSGFLAVLAVCVGGFFWRISEGWSWFAAVSSRNSGDGLKMVRYFR